MRYIPLCAAAAAAVGVYAVFGPRWSPKPIPVENSQGVDFVDSTSTAEITIDFGNIYCGQDAVRSGVFVNTGPSACELVRDQIQSPCSCTSFDVTRDRVEPGQNAEIRVALKTREREGPFSMRGTIVWSQAEKRMVIPILIRGVIVSPARFSAEQIEVDLSKPGDVPASII